MQTQIDSLDTLDGVESLPSTGTSGLDLHVLLISLKRFLSFSVLILLLGSAGGWYLSKQVKPSYQARAVLLRHNKNNTVNPDIYFEPNLKTILETIKIRKNLDRLKQELHLNMSDEQLFNAIEVRPGNRNEIIQILTTADQAQEAAQMANSISRIFQDSSSEISRSVAERVYQFRSGQKQALQQELYQAQGKLAAFQQKHQISFYQDTTRLLLEQIKQLELDQTNAKIQLQKDQLRMQSIRQELAGRPENIKVMSTVRHRTQVKLGEMQIELKGLLERYTPEHPKVLALKQQMQTLEKDIQQATQVKAEEESYGMDPVVRELKIEQAELGSGLSGAQQQLNSLKQAMTEQQQRLRKLSLLEKDFDNLKRDIDRISENLRENDFRLAEAANAMKSKISSFDIVELAQVPTEPLPSGRKLQLFIGILAGLILGFGLPLLIELVDFRIKSPKQIKALSLDYLGLLPTRSSKQNDYYPFWLLFINRFLLRLSHLSGKPQVILVSSLQASEGEHFVAEQILDTLRFRGQNLIHIRPLQTGESTSYDLSHWLQQGDALLPFPLHLDQQLQVYTTQFGELEHSRPLLMNKFAQLVERHPQVDVILWELPPMVQHLPWLLMIAPVANALLIVNRFRGVQSRVVKESLAELKSLQPDLPIYGLLNQVPTAYTKLKG